MYIRHVPSIKKVKLEEKHGGAALYQTWWQTENNSNPHETKPESMKSFTNFAKITLEPSGNNKVHVHENIEQIYLVLRGVGEVQVGEEKSNVTAGDIVFLPAGVPHGFFNKGNRKAVLLLIGTRT